MLSASARSSSKRADESNDSWVAVDVVLDRDSVFSLVDGTLGIIIGWASEGMDWGCCDDSRDARVSTAGSGFGSLALASAGNSCLCRLVRLHAMLVLAC
jgi:hypothetical protein